jgi:hypothetical protein
MSGATKRSDPRLASYLECGEFRFPGDGWAALVEVSPWVSMKEELKEDLEQTAWEYLCLTATSQKSAYVISQRQRSKRVADAAAAFLSALRSDGPDPIHSGLGSHHDGFRRWVDIDLANRRYAELLEMVRILERRERERAQPVRIYKDANGKEQVPLGTGNHVPAKPREKVIRRHLIEDVFQAWLCHAFKDRKVSGQIGIKANIGEIRSFVMAAVQPVLVGTDKFGHGKSGRDALGKEIDHIRKHGFDQLNLARMERFEEFGVTAVLR